MNALLVPIGGEGLIDLNGPLEHVNQIVELDSASVAHMRI